MFTNECNIRVTNEDISHEATFKTFSQLVPRHALATEAWKDAPVSITHRPAGGDTESFVFHVQHRN